MVFCGKFLFSHHTFICANEQLCECFNVSPTPGVSLANLKAWRRAAAFMLLVSNLAAALYTGLIHQRGTLDVMTHLHTLCNVSSTSSPLQPDIVFLMPCHSTPFYRYRLSSSQLRSCLRHVLYLCLSLCIYCSQYLKIAFL